MPDPGVARRSKEEVAGEVIEQGRMRSGAGREATGLCMLPVQAESGVVPASYTTHISY